MGTETPTRKETNYTGLSVEEMIGLAKEVREWDSESTLSEFEEDRVCRPHLVPRNILYAGETLQNKLVIIGREILNGRYGYNILVYDTHLTELEWCVPRPGRILGVSLASHDNSKKERLFNSVDSENYGDTLDSDVGAFSIIS